MSLMIQTNMAATIAHNNLLQTDNNMQTALERLSSGYRINHASDDAAGMAIAQSFSADIASYQQASQNVSEANSLAQVAEGAYTQIGNMLTRLKELATQAASANAGSNLDKINQEGNSLIDEINRIANSTTYAGSQLLNGSFGVTVSTGSGNVGITAGAGVVSENGLRGDRTYTLTTTGSGAATVSLKIAATIGGVAVSQTVSNINVSSLQTGQQETLHFDDLGLSINVNNNLTSASGSGGVSLTTNAAAAAQFQVGAQNSSNDRIGISLDSVTTDSLNISKDQMLTATNAQNFLDSINNAISTLEDSNGAIGAIQNRLGYASANLSTTIENVQSAESVIKDVDMASEMTTYTKDQILEQAGTAMLAQANNAPQSILSLIKG